MELRGCSRNHFISVIKGPEVVKMYNIARGKSVLNYKTIEEIDGSDGSEYDSSSKRPPKVDRSLAMAYGDNDMKTDVKVECMEEENEADFGTLTLKQLKRTCKSRKRKASESVDLAAVKQELNEVPCPEDEPELKETLHSLKRKVLKRSKYKKSKSIQASLSVKTNNSGILALLDFSNEICIPLQVKLEDPEPDFLQPQATSLNLRDDSSSSTSEVVETAECDSSDQPLGITVWDQQYDYLTQGFHENLIQPIYVDTSNCVLNQESQEFRECIGPLNDMVPECSPFVGFHENSMQSISVDTSNCVLNQESQEFRECMWPQNNMIPECSTFEGFYENSMQSMSRDTSNCVLNQESQEFRECMGPQHDMIPDCSTFEDILMPDCPTSTNQPSAFCGSEDDTTDPMASDEERILSDYGPSGSEDDCPQSYAVEVPGDKTPVELQSPRMDGEAQRNDSRQSTNDCKLMEGVRRSSFKNCNSAVIYNTVYNVDLTDNFTSMVKDELSVGDVQASEGRSGENMIYEASQSMDRDTDIESVQRSHLQVCNPTAQGVNCPPSDNHVMSSPSTQLVEHKQSSVPYSSAASLSCSPDIQHAIEEMNEAAISENNEKEMMLHSPERLFSTRKTLSPNSQERLREAMNSAELKDDAELYACKEKPSPPKTEGRSSTSRPDVKRARIIFASKRPKTTSAGVVQTKSQQTLRKETDDENDPELKACVNRIHDSQTTQCAYVCSCVQNCAQNAIAFSKRQMKDTERLATKLVAGLHSMKSIIVDAMQYESRTGAKFRYNTDEVRIAVENVGRLEESAKKWLAMMNRDCNRFRKVMRLSETDAQSPEKPPSKERKIMFADEAGGNLCNVKIFKNSEKDINMVENSPYMSMDAKGEA